MHKGSFLLYFMCSAAALAAGSRARAQQTVEGNALRQELKGSPGEIKNLDRRRLLTELYYDVERLRQDWAKKANASAKARDEYNAAERRIQRDKQIASDLETSAPFLAAEQGQLDKLGTDAATAKEGEAKAERAFKERLDFLQVALNKAKDRQRSGLDSASLRQAQNLPTVAPGEPYRGDICTSERANQVKDDCSTLVHLFEARSPDTLPVGGRVLPSHGVTANLSTTGTSFNYGSSIAIRGRRSSLREQYHRPLTLGLELGIKTEKGRIAGWQSLDERDELGFGDLELLDAGTSFTLGLTLGVFPRMREQAIRKFGADKLEEVKKACIADQDKAEPSYRSFCYGPYLEEWVFGKKDGRFVNLAHIPTYNQIGAAPNRSEPMFGIGTRLQLGFPSFTYFDVPTSFRTDPVTGADVPVFDVANLPEGFVTNEPTKKSHLSWGITGFGFGHWPGRGWTKGHTLIPSVTYRHDWGRRKIFDDISICAPPNGTDAPLCRITDVGDAERYSSLAVALEGRGIYRTNGGLLPPLFGLAPKISWETKRGRKALDLPFFLAANDKGSLVGGVGYLREWGGLDINGKDEPDASTWRVFASTTLDLSGVR